MSTLRVATWNLDGYGKRASERLPKQLEVLRELHADLVVLTEVVDTMVLGGMTPPWWSAQGTPPYKPRDRAVCVASRWPGHILAVTDQRLSVCVALEAPDPLGCVVVYGTIIPYHLDGVRRKAATAWEWHRQAVLNVVADCKRLRLDPAYRDAHLVLAGDFNTCLDGSGWYGDPEARASLLAGLESAGLRCHTLEDIRATRGSHRSIVEHVWTSGGLRPIEPPQIWSDRKEPGQLSDHNGVALSLTAGPS